MPKIDIRMLLANVWCEGFVADHDRADPCRIRPAIAKYKHRRK
ncbi:hypothetical protein [Sphingobium yanoikuyae]|nr:hypothetical protein [Sphingobium yanoikuyae]